MGSEMCIRDRKISIAGLRRRARRNIAGQDETAFLDTLIEIAEAGQTAADRKLALFHGEWNGDIDRVFKEFAY